MKHLILLNDPPYGTERSFNGLRMAHALAKNDPEADITVFLMADAVLCAKAGQKTPDGYYNLERMICRVLSSKGRVLMCGTCMDARGLAGGRHDGRADAVPPWTNWRKRRSPPTRCWCSDGADADACHPPRPIRICSVECQAIG